MSCIRKSLLGLFLLQRKEHAPPRGRWSIRADQLILRLIHRALKGNVQRAYNKTLGLVGLGMAKGQVTMPNSPGRARALPGRSFELGSGQRRGTGDDSLAH